MAKLNSQEEIVRRQQYFKMVELEREKCEDPSQSLGPNVLPISVPVSGPVVAVSGTSGAEAEASWALAESRETEEEQSKLGVSWLRGRDH